MALRSACCGDANVEMVGLSVQVFVRPSGMYVITIAILLNNDNDNIFWGVCVEGGMASTEVQGDGKAKLVGLSVVSLKITSKADCLSI